MNNRIGVKRTTIAITPSTWELLKKHSQGLPMVGLIRNILDEWIANKEKKVGK